MPPKRSTLFTETPCSNRILKIKIFFLLITYFFNTLTANFKLIGSKISMHKFNLVFRSEELRLSTFLSSKKENAEKNCTLNREVQLQSKNRKILRT